MTAPATSSPSRLLIAPQLLLLHHPSGSSPGAAARSSPARESAPACSDGSATALLFPRRHADFGKPNLPPVIAQAAAHPACRASAAVNRWRGAFSLLPSDGPRH